MNLNDILRKLWPWSVISDLEIELADCKYESNLMDIEMSQLESRYTSKSNAYDQARRALAAMRQELSTRVTAAEKKMNDAEVARIMCEERLAQCQGSSNPLEQAVMAISKVEPSEKNWFILNEVTTETMKIAPVALEPVSQSFFNWFNANIYSHMINTNGEFRLPDNQQWSTDIGTWKKIIDRDPTDRTVYVTDQFDCENFVSKLRDNIAETYGLNAFHIAWGKGINENGDPIIHAYGIIYATDGVYVVEPQTDRISTFGYANIDLCYQLQNMVWFE